MPNSEIQLSMEQLAALEPLAGAALALSLAYLALDRFRYRDTIQKLAAKWLDDQKQETPAVSQLTAFHTLVWLAGNLAPHECQMACQEENAKANGNGRSPKVGRPDGVLSSFYGWFFRRNIAEGAVAFFAGSSFATLAAGVCFKSGVWLWLPQKMVLAGIQPWFWLAILGALMPVFTVGLGRLCVSWAEESTRTWGDEVSSTAEKMREGIGKIPVPQPQPDQSQKT